MDTLLEQIPFETEARQRIEHSIQSYGRFARIRFDVALNDREVRVFAIQSEPAPNGKVLTYDELKDRAVKVFEGLLPEGYSLSVTPKPYVV
jgi:hypothetical protein